MDILCALIYLTPVGNPLCKEGINVFPERLVFKPSVLKANIYQLFCLKRKHVG